MILRLDKLLIDLPQPGDASPDSAAAVTRCARSTT